MREMLEKILEKLKGAQKVVFMGIGEEKLTDDGVGPYIISELLSLNSERFKFINAAVDPMTRMNEIIEYSPSHLVLIDTCTLNAAPGTVAILERGNIKDYVPISSHAIPVFIVVDLIMEKLPNLQAFMIGIVPESLEGFTELHLYKKGDVLLNELNESQDLPFFNLHLTDTVKNAADQIIEIIKEILPKL
jgi:hydrogenase maturation protease